MRYLVSVLVRDWPKRTNQFRDKIEVDAESPDEALSLAPEIGKAKWPTGKIQAFDCKPITTVPVEHPGRITLTVKKKVA